LADSFGSAKNRPMIWAYFYPKIVEISPNYRLIMEFLVQIHTIFQRISFGKKP
jgi:hypothetical protein